MFRFGSEDSRDEDYFVVLESPVYDVQECRSITDKYKPFDVNLVCIENGIVTWAFKGTADEMNNSILDTFYLHKSNTEDCPVMYRVNRDIDVKVSRTVRGLLSMFSRTEHRVAIKQALRSESFNDKIAALKLINLPSLEVKNTKTITKPTLLLSSHWDVSYETTTKIGDIFNKSTPTSEVYKFIGFQLVQTMMLVLGNEVYTKKGSTELFPSLYNVIYCIEDKKASIKLQKYLDIFIKYLEKNYTNTFDVYSIRKN